VLTDRSAPPGFAATDLRGLATHEYGHFVACHLARRYGWGELDDLILTVETVAAGSGNPDPDEETRLVNEVLADFFAGQVSGGTNYYQFAGGIGSPRLTGGFATVGGMLSITTPGLDDNQY